MRERRREEGEKGERRERNEERGGRRRRRKRGRRKRKGEYIGKVGGKKSGRGERKGGRREMIGRKGRRAEKEKEEGRETTEEIGEGEVEETGSAHVRGTPVVLKDLKTINIEHSNDTAVTCSRDLYLQLTIDSLDNSCEQPVVDCLQERTHTSEHVHVVLDCHPHTPPFPILPSTPSHTHLG